jgi:hypothetical protein
MIIAPEQEKLIRETFQTVYSTKEDVKALNAANTALLQGLAESLQVEKADIADAYKYWSKIVQKKKGDLGTVDIIVSSVTQN